jgi:protein-S-isoprenylcysteine O-methyltransferase Ste14
MTPTPRLANPGVQFPPPTLFAIPFAIAWLLDGTVRALPMPAVPPPVMRTVGAVVMILGLSLAIWGVAAFRRAMTAIFPNQPANELVTDGPYRFSRNPMYTGFTLLYVGGALAINSLWPFVLLPIVLALLFFLVIRREEAYLADAFGEQYAAYRRHVRRWV